MLLSDLIRDLEEKRVLGDRDVEIDGVAYHSGKVSKGDLFVAIRGTRTDGRLFVAEALDRGAGALVLEGADEKSYGVPVVLVPDSRRALARISAAFFGHPSRNMRVVGVTGTNGKTTTSFLIESMLASDSLACGVLGTINYRYGGNTIPAPMTTPESPDIQRMLKEMLDSGITHVVMEVSSHALDLRRVEGCHFDVGVFTNLTQDHLDYHPSLDQYRRCKEHLFTGIIPESDKPDRTAVLNLDDPAGEDLWKKLDYARMGYAVGRKASFWAEGVTSTLRGIEATVHTPGGDMRIRSPLVGEFNIYNIMAAMGAATALGVGQEAIQKGISALSSIPGRMERIENDRRLEVFVDYAHTPDALERALTVLRPLRRGGRLIVVFGCGGDRDRSKRPLMGRVVARLSDFSVITSDNPRSERPEEIIRDIERGFVSENRREFDGDKLLGGAAETGGYLKVEDRRAAIGLAVRAARPGDIVFIAGKGHENYQIVGDRRLPFDDRVEARAALLKRASNG
ncbi:MAG: UDP-N-acetylmuramoyl-L-alanyl-D-glutamate--2,6-diaminopimelate ligase [Deltaproteobacteria bacterium]|nr:UDP-N-acetylmuramoyl-L-alanyl-D-glutamate--2,6-diaminopimelate ligase [Deltaproteobacteria bacterium]